MDDHQMGVPEDTHDGEQPEDTPQHSPERIKILERDINQWKEQLIEKTRRNNLLFYRDTRTTTLRLDSVNEPARDRLIQGRPVSVDELLLPDIEDEEERDRQLADLKKRATAIFRIAQANQEEAGLETLYLGFGLSP